MDLAEVEAAAVGAGAVVTVEDVGEAEAADEVALVQGAEAVVEVDEVHPEAVVEEPQEEEEGVVEEVPRVVRMSSWNLIVTLVSLSQKARNISWSLVTLSLENLSTAKSESLLRALPTRQACRPRLNTEYGTPSEASSQLVFLEAWMISTSHLERRCSTWVPRAVPV